ncbi:MAG TPA: PorT family protein [Bacteroidetes bacterium]|nr:PorT family protein [Bacteroidota bacterium]
MKKLILSLTVLIALTATTRAQDASPTDLRSSLLFGFKAGINYSNVYDSEGQDFQADSKIGFAGGVFFAIPFGKLFGFQPEILFSQKGYQSTGSILGSTYSMTRTTNWIDLPLLFSFKPVQYINLVAGPQYSYLLSRKDEFTSGNTTTEQEKEFENENIRKNILCFTGGVDLTANRMVIGARAGWDFQTNNGDGTSSTPRYKNMWYQLTLGFRFAG